MAVPSFTVSQPDWPSFSPSNMDFPNIRYCNYYFQCSHKGLVLWFFSYSNDMSVHIHMTCYRELPLGKYRHQSSSLCNAVVFASDWIWNVTFTRKAVRKGKWMQSGGEEEQAGTCTHELHQEPTKRDWNCVSHHCLQAWQSGCPAGKVGALWQET